MGQSASRSSESGACGQSIEYDLKSNQTYYIRVRNRNFLTTFRPAPIGEDFVIQVDEN